MRRKFTRQTEAAIRSDELEKTKKREVQYFEQTTPEFNEALKKISPELLKLLQDQFKAEPDSLLRGAFQDEKSKETQTVQENSEEEIYQDEDDDENSGD